LQTSDLLYPFIGSLLEVPQTADSTEKCPGMMAKLYPEIYWKRRPHCKTLARNKFQNHMAITHLLSQSTVHEVVYESRQA
jgi:hypothetical protein